MDYTFFWFGPFSQWCYSNFVIDNVNYINAEQYMMAEKARLFNDYIALGKIMKATKPREQKQLGRSIKDFNQEVWDEQRTGIVLKGNLAKFSQSDYLLNKLKDTAGTLMVEASPNDKIWGIGLGPKDPKRFDSKNWLGENLLGEVLTVIRRMLMCYPEDQQFKFSWEKQ